MNAVDILAKLIEFQTVSPPGNEAPAAEFLAGLLQSRGFCVQVQQLGNNRANMIAWIGEEGPELMLNGHLDVVPAAGEWTFPPFSMTRKEGRLYGRGSADMKGGVAAMCEAAIRFASKGGPRRGRLKLLFVADEECSNLGTHAYLNANKAPQYAVIGEPTNLEISIAHRGVARDYIDLHEPPRHAALPHEGKDVMEAAEDALRAMRKINEDLKKRSHEVLPPPSVAVTMIQGYEKDNVVPGNVRLLTDFRILPGMKYEEVKEILCRGLEEERVEKFSILPHFFMPGGQISSSDPFVKLCLEERNRLLNSVSGPKAFGASCEQCFLTECGTQALICGPGNLEQAHTVDEFTEEKQVKAAAELYERIINRIL